MSGDGPREAAEALRALDEVTRRLRRECPWDREQDERSIVPHTVEESYELADAIALGDDEAIADELGDVLFQVHFLALLLEERGASTLARVAEACREKLIRRHPHVFGEGADAGSADEVLRNWDRVKSELEGRGEGGTFEDVPESLPALLIARKAQRRAASRAGWDAGRAGSPQEDTLDAVSSAKQAVELARAGASGGPDREDAEREEIEAAIGRALFALVDLARRTRVDPELALRAETGRFMEDFGADPPEGAR